MYADFFGLSQLPFNNTPDPRFFYSTPDHEEALASLIYAVSELKGFVLLTGEVGAGKTLVSRMMLRHFGPKIAFATINHSLKHADDLMESVCTEFDLEFERGATNAELVRLLHDFLLAQFARNKPVALILDEAQNLTVDAFEQLRMIGNLEADNAKLLQIVILGQPELQEKFRSPELRQLEQRIFRSFHLVRLDRDQTKGYIDHRLSVAGAGDRGVFDTDAIDRIYRVSQGLPRLINTACDNAMLSAYSADRHTVDGAFMETIIAQMMTIGSQPAGAAPEERGYGQTAMALAMSVTEAARGAIGLPAPFVASPAGGTRIARRSLAQTPQYSHAAARPETDLAVISMNKGHEECRRSIDHLHERLESLGRSGGCTDDRVGKLERKAAGDDGRIDQADRTMRELNAVTQRAEALLQRNWTADRDFERRHEQMARMARIVQKLHEKTREILRQADDTCARQLGLDQNARRMHAKLVTQGERTGRLAAIMRTILDRVEQRTPLDHGEQRPDSLRTARRIGTQASVPVGAIPLAPRPISAPLRASRLEGLLAQSRESLSDLRTLVRATSEVRSKSAPAHGSDPHSVPTKALHGETPEIPEDDQTARLAREVQDLARMFDSAPVAAP